MLHDRVVQRLVALLLADLDHAGDLVGLAFADEVRDRHVDDENFQRGDAARLVDAFEKVLRDDAFERFGKRGANLVLLVGRENVDDTIDCFRRARGVQRAEDKVAGGRGGQRQLDRFQIAHFTDEKDVRVFAQRAAQGGGERVRVHADFAMLHQAILAAMHELDRVFDRDDVIVPLHVGVIHHRRQRGRFAGTGRAGDQDQALLQHRKFLQHRRQTRDLRTVRTLRRDQTEDRRDAVFLLEEIRAVTGDARNFVAEIDVARFLRRV